MLRGYTIPVIDISGETSRQVTVDREKGIYLGHVTTCLLDDGKTILAAYPKSHGRGQIVLKRSEDGGKTWSPRLPVPDSFSTSLEVPTLFKVRREDGGQRLLLFSGMYPIRMSVSEDLGNSWSELSPIGNYGGIVALGDMIRLKNGDYMGLFHDESWVISPGDTHKVEVYASGAGPDRIAIYRDYDRDENGEWVVDRSSNSDNIPAGYEKAYEAVYEDYFRSAKEPFRVYKIISRDHGLSWSEPVEIASLKDAALCEPGIVRSPDGSEIAVLLRENYRKHNSYVIFSRDEGVSWSEPAELQGALTGDRHTIRYLPDGRLFISFRDTCLESPTHGDWCGWVGTYEDIKNGGEGQYRIRIMKNHYHQDCAYPGVEVLPDGTVVTTTYGHWVEGEKPFIMSVSFKVSELDGRIS
jgi:hypothetical protein